MRWWSIADCSTRSSSTRRWTGCAQHYGLKAIDAVIITHMHGDHFLEAPHLREKWGAKIWALDNMVDKMEHPERFDYSAPIQAYGKKSPDGSLVTACTWTAPSSPARPSPGKATSFTVDWMPGQTEFALCLHGQIDGRNVAFTGDNIFGDPDDPAQTGHEAMVAHNSAILEEGYIYGAEYLHRLKPDILVGGHSFVMDHPGRVHRAVPQVVLRDARRLSGAQPRPGLSLLVRSVLGAGGALPRGSAARTGRDREPARAQLPAQQTHASHCLHTRRALTAEPAVLRAASPASLAADFPSASKPRRRGSRGAHRRPRRHPRRTPLRRTV